jgi:predicted transcriptional regulator
MGKLNKAARSLQELDNEIEALKEKARRLEMQLDETWDYFQEHSGQMFVRSLVPKTFEGLLPQTGIRLVDAILESEWLQKLIERFAEKGAGWLGDVLNWLSNKIFSEK